MKTCRNPSGECYNKIPALEGKSNTHINLTLTLKIKKNPEIHADSKRRLSSNKMTASVELEGHGYKKPNKLQTVITN